MIKVLYTAHNIHHTHPLVSFAHMNTHNIVSLYCDNINIYAYPGSRVDIYQLELSYDWSYNTYHPTNTLKNLI